LLGLLELRLYRKSLHFNHQAATFQPRHLVVVTHEPLQALVHDFLLLASSLIYSFGHAEALHTLPNLNLRIAEILLLTL